MTGQYRKLQKIKHAKYTTHTPLSGGSNGLLDLKLMPDLYRNKISSILPELRPKEENENEANPVGEAIP